MTGTFWAIIGAALATALAGVGSANLLDSLNAKGIRFGLTNLVYHKGKTNEIFLKWAKKYPAVTIDSNYISFNDNTIKKDSVELYVCNY